MQSTRHVPAQYTVYKLLQCYYRLLLCILSLASICRVTDATIPCVCYVWWWRVGWHEGQELGREEMTIFPHISSVLMCLSAHISPLPSSLFSHFSSWRSPYFSSISVCLRLSASFLPVLILPSAKPVMKSEHCTSLSLSLVFLPPLPFAYLSTRLSLSLFVFSCSLFAHLSPIHTISQLMFFFSLSFFFY